MGTITAQVDRRALEIWREQQRDFPRFTYRANPDDIDFATGAWARCVLKAMDEQQALLLIT